MGAEVVGTERSTSCEFSPISAVGFYDSVGLGEGLGACGVGGGGTPLFIPGLEDWGEEIPGDLDGVLAGEEGLVADHAIEEEALV